MAGWTKSKAAGKNGAKAFFVKSGFWLQVLFILSIKIGIWGIVSLRVETKWPNYMLLSYTMHHPPPPQKTTDCRNTVARLNYKLGTSQENWRKIITFVPSLADLDWVHICMVLFAFAEKHGTEIREEQMQIFGKKNEQVHLWVLLMQYAKSWFPPFHQVLLQLVRQNLCLSFHDHNYVSKFTINRYCACWSQSITTSVFFILNQNHVSITANIRAQFVIRPSGTCSVWIPPTLEIPLDA